MRLHSESVVLARWLAAGHATSRPCARFTHGLGLAPAPGMTRSSATSRRPTRQRRPRSSATKRGAAPPQIQRFGVTCFRLVDADEPEIACAFRRVATTRSGLQALVARG